LGFSDYGTKLRLRGRSASSKVRNVIALRSLAFLSLQVKDFSLP